MTAFRIKLNGRKLVTAGLPGYHVMSAIATSVLRRPDVIGKVRRRRAAKPEFKFELGGLWTAPDGAREHVSWTNIRQLKAGDRLSLEIDVEDADKPLHRSRMDAFDIETAERDQLRQLLKKYGRGSSATSDGQRSRASTGTAGGRPAAERQSPVERRVRR